LPATEIERRATDAGISKTALRLARNALRIKPQKIGRASFWGLTAESWLWPENLLAPGTWGQASELQLVASEIVSGLESSVGTPTATWAVPLWMRAREPREDDIDHRRW
jgi:hypothetical protein